MMKVMVDLTFKVDGINSLERIHHLYFPAWLETSDGSLETAGMHLVASKIDGVTVDCSSGGICDKKFAGD